MVFRYGLTYVTRRFVDMKTGEYKRIGAVYSDNLYATRDGVLAGLEHLDGGGPAVVEFDGAQILNSRNPQPRDRVTLPSDYYQRPCPKR